MTNELTIAKTGTLDTIRREIERDPRLKSEHSRRGYLADLTAFEEWRAGRPMTRLLVEEYTKTLIDAGKSPNTINRTLAAIRWWARRLADLAFEGAMDRAQREEIVTQAGRIASVGDVKGQRQQKGRHIGNGELDALLTCCTEDPSPAGARDAAIIALAWATGARRSELAGLTLADLVITGEDDADLVIKGKGDKARTTYLYNGALAYLRDWLAIRGGEQGPLFYAINKGGRVLTGHGVSDEAIAQMLDKRAATAGVRALTWHDFRRTFAGNLLDGGTDLATAQKLMGHSSPVTTAAYDRRPEQARRRALQGVHVPYRRRGLL